MISGGENEQDVGLRHGGNGAIQESAEPKMTANGINQFGEFTDGFCRNGSVRQASELFARFFAVD